LKLDNSDAREIQRLSSSPSFLRLADSILANMDRDTLAELLAGYAYFRSGKRSNLDLALYFATRRFGKTLTMGINIIAALVPGLLFDKKFRSVIFGAASKSFGSKKDSKKYVSLSDDD
jgi:hypothetical protein